GGPIAFLALQPVLIGPFTLPLWFMGWYFLFARPAYRPLGVAALVTFLLFLAVGKAYYPGPLIPVLVAAGCVQLERVASRFAWRRAGLLAGGAMLLQAAVMLPIGLPLVPQASLHRFGLDQFRKDFADTVGWPELVVQVAVAYQHISPAEQRDTVILARNYGEAGAIDLYGPRLGLPNALSPHLTYWFWKPPHLQVTNVITVGFDEAGVRRACADATLVGTIQAVDNVLNEEVGRPIMLCRRPIVPLDQSWPELRSFA
ncbi:MAG: hypothetical protein JOY61_05120, partial [Chloroflexi bacterium]|nr:hypothetical protein [Chloroflexota bacterium]